MSDSILDQRIEVIARVCHEASCGYQRAVPVPGIEEAKRWDFFCHVYPDQADGVREGVAKALEGATPEELHGSWCARKHLEGWKYGDVKDPAAKTHPCLVAYAELPETQRVKDRLFAAIVHALAPSLFPSDE